MIYLVQYGYGILEKSNISLAHAVECANINGCNVDINDCTLLDNVIDLTEGGLYYTSNIQVLLKHVDPVYLTTFLLN